MHRFERQSGIVLALVTMVIGIWPLPTEGAILWPWLLLSFGLLLLSWLVPTVLWPLAKLWQLVGHVLGYINTRLLLAIVFFGLITPIALLFRLTGRDVLALKFKKKSNKAASYWKTAPRQWPPESFKNQF